MSSGPNSSAEYGSGSVENNEFDTKEALDGLKQSLPDVQLTDEQKQLFGILNDPEVSEEQKTAAMEALKATIAQEYVNMSSAELEEEKQRIQSEWNKDRQAAVANTHVQLDALRQ